MIFKAIKSISVGVLIQLGFGLAVQGLAQAGVYCPGPQDSSHCLQQRQQEQERQLQRLQDEAWYREFRTRNDSILRGF